jgi:hypothetical protein
VVVPGDAVAAVDAELTVPRTQEHPDPVLVDLAGLAEHLQYVGAQEFL